MLISTQSYRSPISYIHKPTLARHVGDTKSLHQCCKKEVLFSNGEIYVVPVQQQESASSLSQSSIDTGIVTSSYTYFEKVLYIVQN